MHSNGGCGLVPEAKSPAVDESRRVGHPAALPRRRSFGETGLIVGASVERLIAVSVMGVSKPCCSIVTTRLHVSLYRSTEQLICVGMRRISSTLECPSR